MEEKNLGGRPEMYTKELADSLCAAIAEGKSLRTVCQLEGMPTTTSFFRWLRKYPEFSIQYAQAKEESSEALNEELMDLGDKAIVLAQEVDPKSSSAVVQAVKLKADNHKWMMSKMKPKKYGEKIDLTTNGKDLPAPIYSGQAISLPRHDSHPEDIQPEEKN